MGVADWNWKLATDLQDYTWDCAACSTAWALRTVGYELSEEDVIEGLGPARISPALGLLDASGAGLVQYLAEIGVTASNNPNATWQEITDAAGYQPMVMGGREWCHWVGVRMGASAAGIDPQRCVLLMNPSPGYRDVWQSIDVWQFEQLGPFSAVWFTSW
jgi:hypothetical protein